MRISDNFELALDALLRSRQRTLLTILIIAIGITAIVGIFSAIEAIRLSVEDNFSEAGANTFTIEHRWQSSRRFKSYRVISYREAMEFKKYFSQYAPVSVKVYAAYNAVVRYRNKKSNPNVEVIGADENHLLLSGTELAYGRMFSEQEAIAGSHLAVIGDELKKNLFKNRKALHEIIYIGNVRFRIIGVTRSKGAAAGFGGDRTVIIPIQTARQYFLIPNTSFQVSCLSVDYHTMPVLIEEAAGIFRRVRKLSVWDENDFEISRADNLVNIVMKDISMITEGASFIGAITLIGAGIGLMNIMLISVQERINEIGIRKALGATRRDISVQFLFESAGIGIAGGMVGLVLGIIIGNLVSLVLGSGLFIPWKWVFGGFVLCLAVGIFSGLYPSRKAANVDPIESLRYE